MSNLVEWPKGDPSQLKPCPFCGWDKPVIQEAAIEEETGEVIGPAYVQCLECGCVGPFSVENTDDEVAAWNTRATLGGDA
jgi:Lar family restriction alleviation protein